MTALMRLRPRHRPACFTETSSPNNADDGAAQFEESIHTFYAQDVWTGIPDLTVTAGLRIDMFSVDDEPLRNARFQQRYGFPNNDTLDSKSVIQPRIAFDWQASERLLVTAGYGRFAGGNPGVFFSNNYSNTGFSGPLSLPTRRSSTALTGSTFLRLLWMLLRLPVRSVTVS